MMKTTVFLSDLQGYKVDRKAWRSTLAFLRNESPDVIVLGGDTCDFEDVSKYRKNPSLRVPIHKEAAFVKKHILAPLAELDARVVFMSRANHEERYVNFVWDRCPELYGVVPPLNVLLELDKYDIECYTEREYWVNRRLACIHGYKALKNSCATARSTLADMKVSVVMGHTHRMGMYYESGARGKEHVAVENGHLMDPKWATYLDRPGNWQQGFSVIYDHGRGLFHIEQAKILKGRVYYAGTVT
jgi:predicted phosphodiesterase